jgi:FAD/FMN-containing dehydrogenase
MTTHNSDKDLLMPPIESTKLQCVNDRLAGRILAPGDDGWDESRIAFNLLIDQRPAMIALPADPHDVTMIVRLAAEHALRVAPQATGHNAGPLGDLSESILLRTSAMNEVRVDVENRSARAGAGARWQDLVPQASQHGLAALHGSSPSVGIVGYSLGGGVGWYARRFGLQSNSVTAVELVTADGRQLRASAESEPDLFWALRGGAGNFGVVTAIEFDLYEVSEIYAGALFFPYERSGEVLQAYNEWQADLPDEATTAGRMMQFPPFEQVPEPVRGKSFAIVEMAFTGSESDGADLIAPLRALRPGMDTFAMVPPEALGMLHMDPPEPVPAVTGHLLLEDLPPEGMDALVAAGGPESGSRLVAVDLRQLGGALGRSEESSGALGSVPGSLALFAVGVPAGPEDGQALVGQITAVTHALAPYDAGRALNFTEQPFDPAAAFPPESYERLRKVKGEYDPDGVMHANHPLPPA